MPTTGLCRNEMICERGAPPRRPSRSERSPIPLPSLESLRMSQSKPLTVLCLASYEKGHEFLRECKRQGCRVLLLTSQSITDAQWPHESVDEIYLMPDDDKKWDMND